MAKPSLFSIQGRFSKIRELVLLTDRKAKTKEQPKDKYLAFEKAFIAAENENRHLKDLPQADFGRVREKISSVQGKSQ